MGFFWVIVSSPFSLRCLAMSVHFGCSLLGWADATVLWWVVLRDPAKCSKMHKTVPMSKNKPAQNVGSAEKLRKHCCQLLGLFGDLYSGLAFISYTER